MEKMNFVSGWKARVKVINDLAKEANFSEETDTYSIYKGASLVAKVTGYEELKMLKFEWKRIPSVRIIGPEGEVFVEDL